MLQQDSYISSQFDDGFVPAPGSCRYTRAISCSTSNVVYDVVIRVFSTKRIHTTRAAELLHKVKRALPDSARTANGYGSLRRLPKLLLSSRMAFDWLRVPWLGHFRQRSLTPFLRRRVHHLDPSIFTFQCPLRMRAPSDYRWSVLPFLWLRMP